MAEKPKPSIRKPPAAPATAVDRRQTTVYFKPETLGALLAYCAAQKSLPGVKARSEGAEMSSVVDRAVREFLDRQGS